MAVCYYSTCIWSIQVVLHYLIYTHILSIKWQLAGRVSRHFTGLYTVSCTSHPVLSIGGSTGQFDGEEWLRVLAVGFLLPSS